MEADSQDSFCRLPYYWSPGVDHPSSPIEMMVMPDGSSMADHPSDTLLDKYI